MLRRNAASVGAEERTRAGAPCPRDCMAAGLHVPGARRRRPPPAQCRAAPGSGPQQSRAAAEPGPGRGELAARAAGTAARIPPLSGGAGEGSGGEGKERRAGPGPDQPLSAFSGSRVGSAARSAARSRPTRRGADLVCVPRAGGGSQRRAGAALAVRAVGADRAALRLLPAAPLPC